VSFALTRDPGLFPLLSEPERNMAEILRRLSEVGAREASEMEVEKRIQKAEEIAKRLPWGDGARAEFRELLTFLATREA
jgi:geranylgeranyl pyrophosphate synthase